MNFVATNDAPKAIGPYSQGVVQNGVLYTAGRSPWIRQPWSWYRAT